VPVFVVHEHHARRLHWDFRLEMDGVLRSWAVPKGPSMNPAEKRLAVMVGDHDLAYAAFEGEIEEGAYGAGRVYIWDQGTYEPVGGSLESGKFEFRIEGGKLSGAFVLLRLRRGKPADWLLIKERDSDADPGFTLVPVGGE
jgi:bifunctional non-homologous end joining protein LigD